MTEDNWIGIITPTKDGKYMMARATIDEHDVETLSDCMVSVSDTDGKKEDLKYPFVLIKDIDCLREKLIEDIDTLDCTEYSKLEKWELIEEVLEIIDKRFGVEE